MSLYEFKNAVRSPLASVDYSAVTKFDRLYFDIQIIPYASDLKLLKQYKARDFLNLKYERPHFEGTFL